jgi:hypothetical protein
MMSATHNAITADQCAEADREQHPDRDEEETVEDVAKGDDIRDDLMAVVGLGEDEPGNECPERHREPEMRGQPGRAEADQNDEDDEDLRAPQPHDVMKQEGDESPRGEDDPGHDGRRRRQLERDIRRR